MPVTAEPEQNHPRLARLARRAAERIRPEGAQVDRGPFFSERVEVSGESRPVGAHSVVLPGFLAESDEHLPVNLGNPNEFSILELAETVIKVTSSTSEIVYEALPVDDPQVRQPDITRARQVLGWEPEIQLEEGLRRMLPSLGREPLAI